MIYTYIYNNINNKEIRIRFIMQSQIQILDFECTCRYIDIIPVGNTYSKVLKVKYTDIRIEPATLLFVFTYNQI